MAYMSNVAAVNDAVKGKGFELKHVAISEGEDYSCKPLQLYMTKEINPGVANELLAGLKNIDLEIKIIDKSDKLAGNKYVSIYFHLLIKNLKCHLKY